MTKARNGYVSAIEDYPTCVQQRHASGSDFFLLRVCCQYSRKLCNSQVTLRSSRVNGSTRSSESASLGVTMSVASQLLRASILKIRYTTPRLQDKKVERNLLLKLPVPFSGHRHRHRHYNKRKANRQPASGQCSGRQGCAVNTKI